MTCVAGEFFSSPGFKSLVKKLQSAGSFPVVEDGNNPDICQAVNKALNSLLGSMQYFFTSFTKDNHEWRPYVVIMSVPLQRGVYLRVRCFSFSSV